MNTTPNRTERVVPIAVTSALFASAAVAAVGMAAAFVAVQMARAVVTPPRRKIEDLRVLASTTSTVTLSVTEDSLTPGRYSLWFDQGAGHARIGEILEVTATSVTRQVLDVDFGTLHAGVRARFSGWFYLGPRELGYPYENVDVATPIGPAPAWYIPAAASATESDSYRNAWAIHVHGRGVRRSEGLRAVPVFHQAGYSSLLISYRNDEDAPNSDDHRYSLGDAEWQDVEAAIKFAIDHGAREIVLVGWSMGGATVLQAATRSSHPEVIRGIVLDSPVIDWVNVLNFQGAQLRAPVFVRRAALAIISSPWGSLLTGQSQPIDLERLDFVRRAGELRWPILLMHSDDDGYVPAEGSQTLARLRPDIVTFERFLTARHTKLWNYDTVRWDGAIARWLAQFE